MRVTLLPIEASSLTDLMAAQGAGGSFSGEFGKPVKRHSIKKSPARAGRASGASKLRPVGFGRLPSHPKNRWLNRPSEVRASLGRQRGGFLDYPQAGL